jgi:CheY-like chemotaxis protein
MSTVLVIEDNREYREILVEILQLESYQTVTAANGLIGLQKLQEHPPNLIVCDVDMPVMNGREVLQIVKADPVLSMIPFLILTAHTDRQMQEELLDLGVEAILAKPIAVEEFLAVVANVLNQNAATI